MGPHFPHLSLSRKVSLCVCLRLGKECYKYSKNILSTLFRMPLHISIPYPSILGLSAFCFPKIVTKIIDHEGLIFTAIVSPQLPRCYN